MSRHVVCEHCIEAIDQWVPVTPEWIRENMPFPKEEEDGK